MKSKFQFTRALLDFFFPPLCHVCRKFIANADKLHLCDDCLEQFKPIISPLCNVCGIPFSGVGNDHICGGCALNKPYYDSARAAYVYEGHCRTLIHRFKYNNKIHLRRPLALLTASRLNDFIVNDPPDMIVPVPLHKQRLRQRGFNQAVLLGELLSQEWCMPLERMALARIRRTEPQIRLTANERQLNVKDAFAVGNSIVSGKRILLLDDVMTTGSTVNECAKFLKKSGAVRVMVITVARAINL